MTKELYRDLAKLARSRTREAAISVTQLLDNDAEKAALLVSVSIDFLNGACVMLLDDEEGITPEEALGTVMMMIIDTIGAEKVANALKVARTGR
jgi:hypothetical protein